MMSEVSLLCGLFPLLLEHLLRLLLVRLQELLLRLAHRRLASLRPQSLLRLLRQELFLLVPEGRHRLALLGREEHRVFLHEGNAHFRALDALVLGGLRLDLAQALERDVLQHQLFVPSRHLR